MTLFFLVFLILIIYTAFMVVLADHPINALLFFIALLISFSVTLIFMHLEFLALVFIAIYVGAIAIFFLFVIMMMNIPSFFAKKFIFDEYLFALICFFVVSLLSLFGYTLFTPLVIPQTLKISNIPLLLDYTNSLEMLGLLLYTNYFVVVLICGVLLFFAMVTSILLLEQSKRK